MSAAWVAPSVRARLLLRRAVGAGRAVELGRCRSLREALIGLSGTAYGRYLDPGLDLEDAQRAVAATFLLHLRLLSGWLPPGQAGFLRVLAAGLELVNIEDRLAYLHGAELRSPFDLGGLASAWPVASQALSPAELRAALARSAWGDPGGETPEAVHLGLRLSLARRVLAEAPELRDLVAGAVALLLARELFVIGRPVEPLLDHPLPGLPGGWERARTLEELAASLPPQAAWALTGVDRAEELWQAEAAWWRRAASEGERLVRAGPGRGPVVGTVLLLAADAWRVQAALAAAARGGVDLEEVVGATA